MWELVYHSDMGLPVDDRLRVHFFEARAAILDHFTRNHLQALGLGNRVFTGVGFEVTDDDVDAVRFRRLCLVQHLIGFADTGRIAEKDLQFASRAGPGPAIRHGVRRFLGRKCALMA